jgi:hypothetical protein
MTVSSLCGLAPDCDSASTAAPDPQVVQLADFTAYGFEWLEADTGPALTQNGQSDDMFGRIGVIIEGTSNDPDGSGFFAEDLGGGDPHQGIVTMFARCDSIVDPPDTADGDDGSGDMEPPTGCIDNKNVPTLMLPHDTYGASADMIQWAQDTLTGVAMGQPGNPLHRLGDQTAPGNNRSVICDDSFTPDSAMTAALTPYSTPSRPETDSCDEFPFAATYESGAMTTGADGSAKPHVTTGADCAQVTAQHTGTSGDDEPGDWNTITEIGTPAGSEPCVRGHVPLRLNTGVGGAYGRFSRNNRLLDKDPFYVQVT